jgi:hypothetical protein
MTVLQGEVTPELAALIGATKESFQSKGIEMNDEETLIYLEKLTLDKIN